MKKLTQLKLAAFYGLGALPPVRRLVRACPGHGALLLYHQVYPFRDPAARRHPMAVNVVSPERFDEQIRCIKQHYTPVTLNELHQQSRGAPPKRLPVVITFDDGHRDNLDYALPVLERHQVPATIYITTGFLDGSATPWWLELWDLLQERATLALADAGSATTWPLRTESQRWQCYVALAQRMRNLPLTGQAMLLAVLRDGRDRPANPPHFLSPDTVRMLDRHPLITIGAHTQNHAALRAESAAVAREEMAGSKRVLEALLGHPVPHLAYPFGSPETADAREFKLAADCGFATAVTTRPETFHGRDWLQIPRHSVRESHSAARLQVKLSGWNARWRQSV